MNLKKYLLGLPFLTVTFDGSVPYLVMAGVTMLHSTVSELVFRTTAGKAVVRARVVALAGDVPRPRQLLLRNAAKCLVVLVPPLALVAVMNPNGQGLDDLAGQTLVVRRQEPAAEDGS